MLILRPIFNILAISGCWKPSSWSSTWKSVMYHCYATFVHLALHIFTLSQFLDMVLNVQTAEELSDSIYMFMASVTSCCKLNAFIMNKRSIKTLIGKLREEPCKPLDTEEVKIRETFDKAIGSSTIRYITLVETTVFCIILSSTFTNLKNTELVYRAWLPYDYTSSKLFYVTYVHQMLGLIANSLLNVGCDSMICGLVVHTCSQIEILKYRLKMITPQTKRDLQKCVRYHNYIHKYAIMINQKFKTIIGIQFLSSTLVICFNLYQLSNTALFNSKYLEYVLYMACMMTEIFFYCWYGHQLKLKSIEIISAVYEMDWTILDEETRKNILMIMKRALTPIEFTSAYIIPMDLNTFVGIMKMSYSVYNLL